MSFKTCTSTDMHVSDLCIGQIDVWSINVKGDDEIYRDVPLARHTLYPGHALDKSG